MHHILTDTCVWLDLAKDPRQLPVLAVIEELLSTERVELIVPDIVLDEFKRNRDRVASESEKSLSSHFKLVREAAGRASAQGEDLESFFKQLDEVAHRIPQIGGHATETLDRIEELLTSAEITESTDPLKLKAAQRAIEKKAPFHNSKNSMGDALIIEHYGNCLNTTGSSDTRYCFVTHNNKDFSRQDGNQKEPHPDLTEFFPPGRSHYFLNLAEALHEVDEELVADLMIIQTWETELRSLSEITESEDLLMKMIWYNRHKIREEKISRNEIRIVKSHSGFSNDEIKEEIWEGALVAAKEVEDAVGKHNLGPHSDFEWGMLNGKLSALRWVLGDEWDMLYT